MLKKTISLFTFGELSQDAKKKVIERNRYINTELDEWWEGIFDDFIFKAKAHGLYIDYDNIQFTGFCSQGDGASFVCKTGDIDTETIIDKFDVRFNNEGGFYKFKEDEVKKDFCQRVYFVINRISWRYSHAYTVEADYTLDEGGIDDEMIDYFHRVAQETCKKIDKLKNDLCGELYRELDKKYFELISDEAVADAVQNFNDLYFNNGALFTEGLAG